jgi:hypothetical protein
MLSASLWNQAKIKPQMLEGVEVPGRCWLSILDTSYTNVG